MNEDLVYGILSDEDILTDANGHETEGINTFRIESFKGKVEKKSIVRMAFISPT